jgi:hypothetical protein
VPSSVSLRERMDCEVLWSRARDEKIWHGHDGAYDFDGKPGADGEATEARRGVRTGWERSFCPPVVGVLPLRHDEQLLPAR